MAFKIEQHKELTQVTTRQDTSLGIMKWGNDNSFPQTLENLIEQSPIAKPAVKRTAKFYKGSGFEGEDQVVSPNGLTLKQVVAMMADAYAMYEGFALQCNFNLKGEVTGINPMRIPELRFNELDELNSANQIGYHENFGRNSVIKKTVDNTVTKGKIKWFNRFNPKAVTNQILETEGGIDNYLGQILYYSEAGYSMYPIPPLQSAVNYVLSDIENSILIRKSSTTGFVNSYLLKTTMDSEDPTLMALEDSIDESQGARGTGRVITMSNMAPEELAATVLEELGSTGKSKTVVESAAGAFELSRKVINGAYLIPPILGGDDQKTGFSTNDLKDAYFVFNAITKSGRDIIENQLNRILAISKFDTKSISLNKLTLDIEEEKNVEK